MAKGFLIRRIDRFQPLAGFARHHLAVDQHHATHEIGLVDVHGRSSWVHIRFYWRKRRTRSRPATVGLLRADMGVANDLVPFRDLSLDALTEFRWRINDRVEAEFGEPLFDLRVSHHLDDLGIPAPDDLRWRADRSDNASQR